MTALSFEANSVTTFEATASVSWSNTLALEPELQSSVDFGDVPVTDSFSAAPVIAEPFNAVKDDGATSAAKVSGAVPPNGVVSAADRDKVGLASDATAIDFAPTEVFTNQSISDATGFGAEITPVSLLRQQALTAPSGVDMTPTRPVSQVELEASVANGGLSNGGIQNYTLEQQARIALAASDDYLGNVSGEIGAAVMPAIKNSSSSVSPTFALLDQRPAPEMLIPRSADEVWFAQTYVDPADSAAINNVPISALRGMNIDGKWLAMPRANSQSDSRYATNAPNETHAYEPDTNAYTSVPAYTPNGSVSGNGSRMIFVNG
jgi:hypothetical protein